MKVTPSRAVIKLGVGVIWRFRTGVRCRIVSGFAKPPDAGDCQDRRLVRTDFKARCHGTIGGFVWALLKPVTMFIVLYAVFSFVFASNPAYRLNLIIGLFLYGSSARRPRRGSSRCAPIAVAFRRSAWEAAGGFDETLDALVACDFLLRVHEQGGEGVRLERPGLRRIARRATGYRASLEPGADAWRLPRVEIKPALCGDLGRRLSRPV